MATRSCGRSSFTSMRNDALSSGSLSGDCMEPETSSRKTRLLGGRSRVSTRSPWMPMRTSLWSVFQGAAVTSVVIEKG